MSLCSRIPEWAEEACKPGGPMEEIAKVVYLLRAKPDLVRFSIFLFSFSFSFLIFNYFIFSKQVRIRSGFLIKEMLERFKAKQNGTLTPDRSLWMYSAHSSTITTLLNGLRFNLVR